ncbi:Developmentally-regulated GTP-binding protein 1 [Phytophthora nicotianae]|uniref:Developmentally-regulated GTP-binding protein 1 n=1 Tax=Phytophthora nicotianae TaxID=4792 RepID=A0A0W8CZX8_PHYNI|nr:Developmentally-regulated GTP-binding protein 1 [Phytophthora nicotianae]
MSIDSEQRGVSAAATAAAECEAKRAEVQRLRGHLDKLRAGEDDEDALLLALAQPVSTTDPLSCLCCCKFKRLGHSYAMFLSQHVETMAWYNTLITLGLCSVTLYYLFQTTCTDPGIIRPPRQKDVSQTEDESEGMELEAGQAPVVEGAMLPAEAFGLVARHDVGIAISAASSRTAQRTIVKTVECVSLAMTITVHGWANVSAETTCTPSNVQRGVGRVRLLCAVHRHLERRLGSYCCTNTETHSIRRVGAYAESIE